MKPLANRKLSSPAILGLLVAAALLVLPACKTFGPEDFLTKREQNAADHARARHESAQRVWAVAHYHAGKTAFDAADMPEAFRHFKAATIMRPDWSLPWLELALVHPLWDHNRAAELQALKRAAELNPDNPRIQLALGVVLAQDDDFTAAEAHLQTAIRQRGEWEEAHFRLANLYRRMEEPKKAIEHFAWLIARQPENTSLHAILADLYEKTGETQRAEHHLIRLTHLKGDYAWVYMKLGQFYQRHGQPQKAQNAFAKARSISPDGKKTRRMRPLLPSRR